MFAEKNVILSNVSTTKIDTILHVIVRYGFGYRFLPWNFNSSLWKETKIYRKYIPNNPNIFSF